jgi:hypothetical protein
VESVSVMLFWPSMTIVWEMAALPVAPDTEMSPVL